MLLLGTKEEVPVEPVQRTVFVEDMDEAELATAVRILFFVILFLLFYFKIFNSLCLNFEKKIYRIYVLNFFFIIL